MGLCPCNRSIASAGSGLRPFIGFGNFRPATAAQLELIHSPAHVRSIAELCAAGGGAIDLDTYAGAESFTAAEHAAGAACAMVPALLAGEAEVGFCAVRPSGHHAEPDRDVDPRLGRPSR